MDARITETYVADSKATLKNALYDPYVKAFSWASERIGNEGIVAFVTNNGFLDGIAFDGMRKHLAQDFTKIYHIDLKGNARTSGERRRKEGGNVFDDQIRVGVGISFFIKKADVTSGTETEVWIYSVDDYLKAREKQQLLIDFNDCTDVPMKKMSIDAKYTWLTEGLHTEFDTFIPIGTKEAKVQKDVASDVIFKTYCRGVTTNRDAWVYNFSRNILSENVQRTIEYYRLQALRWEHRENRQAKIVDFVESDLTKIKWDRELRQHLQRGRTAEYTKDKVRTAFYRPFTKSNLFFDRVLNNCVYLFPSILPVPSTELENRIICVSGIGSKKPFHALVTDMIPSLDLLEKTQCFPFYTYDEDGTDRRENITDWALAEFRTHYADDTITKWDIFHYNYGLLHHPAYREKYEMNLKRDLPHIPFAEDFWGFANAGAALADLHVNYESQSEYDKLNPVETPGMQVNLAVERMKFSKDKTQLKYNEFLTLEGIPPEVFDYRLGNRSALEWIVDQYRVKTDKRSGIVNDPNRENEPRYILELIARVITVSLKTVEIVNGLPPL